MIRRVKEIYTPPAEEGHSDAVNSVAFSPDGKLLASGSKDKRIGLWDISDPSKPRLIKRLKGYSIVILSVAFSPDGKLLASGGSDNRVSLWDVFNPSKAYISSIIIGEKTLRAREGYLVDDQGNRYFFLSGVLMPLTYEDSILVFYSDTESVILSRGITITTPPYTPYLGDLFDIDRQLP